jgi:hypothetical protein
VHILDFLNPQLDEGFIQGGRDLVGDSLEFRIDDPNDWKLRVATICQQNNNKIDKRLPIFPL